MLACATVYAASPWPVYRSGAWRGPTPRLGIRRRCGAGNNGRPCRAWRRPWHAWGLVGGRLASRCRACFCQALASRRPPSAVPRSMLFLGAFSLHDGTRCEPWRHMPQLGDARRAIWPGRGAWGRETGLVPIRGKPVPACGLPVVCHGLLVRAHHLKPIRRSVARTRGAVAYPPLAESAAVLAGNPGRGDPWFPGLCALGRGQGSRPAPDGVGLIGAGSSGL
jgi:hypothetical protein